MVTDRMKYLSAIRLTLNGTETRNTKVFGFYKQIIGQQNQENLVMM